MKLGIPDITKRTPREVAERIYESYSQQEIIKIILMLDELVAEYPFTFSVIKSLIHDAVDEDGFSQKKIQEMITEAKLYKKYE